MASNLARPPESLVDQIECPCAAMATIQAMAGVSHGLRSVVLARKNVTVFGQPAAKLLVGDSDCLVLVG